MASSKYIVGLFDSEDTLVEAIRSLKKKKIEITNAYTPFPVHGLEHELGYNDSRLHTAGFMFGSMGTLIALSVMTWILTTNYPTNFGGKPHFSLPAMIPITFELTVLCAAVGMVVVYCVRNGLAPTKIPKIFDERITDDHFALTFEIKDTFSENEVKTIVSALKESGAKEVIAKEFVDKGVPFMSETTAISGLAQKPKASEPKKANASTSTTKKIEEKPKAKSKKLSKEEEKEKTVSLLNIVGKADGTKDDLKKIKGIGPVYEKRLNDLGISTFKQIANMNKNAREAVEDLTGFPGRVEREDWVGQAKKLLK